MTLSFYGFLPFLLIIVLNILKIRKIQLQKAFRSQRQQSREPFSAYKSSFIVMMVCVCSDLAVTSFPASILTIVSYSCNFETGGLCTLGHGGWLSDISFMLDDINHRINFFLYCLTGCIFRFAFFHVFNCRQKRSP